MPDLLTNGHPNGSGASLLTPARLLVGAGALLLVLISTGVVLILQANASHEARILRLEGENALLRTDLARLRTTVDVVDETARMTRTEQVDRTKAFGAINEKLVLLEQKLLYAEQRTDQRLSDFARSITQWQAEVATRQDTMSKRILALVERRDTQHPPPPSAVIP